MAQKDPFGGDKGHSTAAGSRAGNVGAGGRAPGHADNGGPKSGNPAAVGLNPLKYTARPTVSYPFSLHNMITAMGMLPSPALPAKVGAMMAGIGPQFEGPMGHSFGFNADPSQLGGTANQSALPMSPAGGFARRVVQQRLAPVPTAVTPMQQFTNAFVPRYQPGATQSIYNPVA